MKVKNVTSEHILVQDMRSPSNAAVALILAPNVSTLLYNEDAEKSNILKYHIDAGNVLVEDKGLEPNSTSSVGDDSNDVINWVLSNDKLIQFITDSGDIATNDPEIYTATANVAKTVRIAITDGDGTRDLLNSVSTVLVTASGGTVNGVASVTLTFSNGLASMSVLKASAGNVDLTLSDITHQLSSEVPPTLVEAAGAAQVQFS